ncbi:unnamed protein product [Prorocentrum cordatum]|uniref:Apple domain-containing protein n=1 Tax=Prorocentrum cordatum TaxID=2364126 RepID=A0ABN9QFQ9_9DINO|nr:unnamed protein product [Polarella glacialis]
MERADQLVLVVPRGWADPDPDAEPADAEPADADPPTPSPPTPLGECSAVWEARSNRGTSLREVSGVSSAYYCQQLCSREQRCRGWTYASGQCWLKSSVECMLYEQGAQSGYCRPCEGPSYCGFSCGGPSPSPYPTPSPPAPGEGCSDIWETNANHGANLRQVPGVGSARHCQQQCAREQRCRGWTYASGQCWLKSSVGCMSYDAGAQSGYCRPWYGPSSCGYGPTRSHAPAGR